MAKIASVVKVLSVNFKNVSGESRFDTYGRKDMKKLRDVFRTYANAPNKGKKKTARCPDNAGVRR